MLGADHVHNVIFVMRAIWEDRARPMVRPTNASASRRYRIATSSRATEHSASAITVRDWSSAAARERVLARIK